MFVISCLRLFLKLCWMFYTVFLLHVACCFYITELSTWGRNGAVIWIYLLEIYSYSNIDDRNSDAHDSDRLLPLRAGLAIHDQRVRVTQIGTGLRREGNHASSLWQPRGVGSVTLSVRCTWENPSHHWPSSIVYKQRSAVQLSSWFSASSGVYCCVARVYCSCCLKSTRRCRRRHLVIRYCARYRFVDTPNCRPHRMRHVRPPHDLVVSMNPRHALNAAALSKTHAIEMLTTSDGQITNPNLT